jgi:hypothetical protein
MLDEAKRHGLRTSNDLSTYVVAILEAPERSTERRWLMAIQQAVLNQVPLDAYFLV